MSLAIQNRNNSYSSLCLPKRMAETYDIIKKRGACTPQQVLSDFKDGRLIHSVSSRFTDLHERGYIKPILSWINKKSGKPNTVYEVTTMAERIEYSKAAGIALVNRKKELENDFHCAALSPDTEAWIKNEIKKINNKLKHLINI